MGQLEINVKLLNEDGNIEDSSNFKSTFDDLKVTLKKWSKEAEKRGDDYSLEIEYIDGDIKLFDELYKYMMSLSEDLSSLLSQSILEVKAKKKLKVDPMTGKKVIKWKCPPKSKLDSSTNPPACIKMKPDEIIAKKKAMKKAVRTRKQGKEMKDKTAQLKRKRTLKIRKSLGLDKK